jgi:hypothetical protein
VQLEVVPLAMRSLKETLKLKAGISIIGGILQEAWPVRSAMSISFKGMVMSPKENAFNVIKSLRS